ncbi:hypothetical protein SprV_0401633700 [Sparganum proliferum]
MLVGSDGTTMAYAMKDEDSRKRNATQKAERRCTRVGYKNRKSTSAPPVSADTTAKNTTDRGNASSVVDLLGDFGSSLLRGVSGVLEQVSTGGITTGGGSGNSSEISTVKYNEPKARKPDTKPVVIKISRKALGNYFRAHLLDTVNVLFQWIQEKKHVLARNAFAYLLVKEFLDIISMGATVQEAAIDKFLTENTGVIEHGDALSTQKSGVECNQQCSLSQAASAATQLTLGQSATSRCCHRSPKLIIM